MAYLLIDGLGKDDARDILRGMTDEVHVYSRDLYAPQNDLVQEVYGDDDREHYDLFDGYDCYVVSDSALTEDQIAATIQADDRYTEACEKWLQTLKEDAAVV